jgi:ferric-dicitrate binding protein FerR (iron transport regulator)
MSKNQQDNIEPAKKLAETVGRRRPGQARSDAGVGKTPRRTWLLAVLLTAAIGATVWLGLQFHVLRGEIGRAHV